VVLPRLNTDIIDIFEAVIDERLDEVEISWNDSACVCVIMASGGYPKEYKTGYEISGIEDAERDANIVVFHAGTKRENGNITPQEDVCWELRPWKHLDEAIKKAYEGVGKIKFQDMHYRKDIGKSRRA